MSHEPGAESPRPGSRHPLAAAVTLAVELRPTSEETVLARTLEVRLDGLVLESPSPLRAGLLLDYRVAGFSLNLDGRALVKSCEPLPDREAFRVTLELPADLSMIERERLARFVVERRRQAGHG